MREHQKSFAGWRGAVEESAHRSFVWCDISKRLCVAIHHESSLAPGQIDKQSETPGAYTRYCTIALPAACLGSLIATAYTHCFQEGD